MIYKEEEEGVGGEVHIEIIKIGIVRVTQPAAAAVANGWKKARDGPRDPLCIQQLPSLLPDFKEAQRSET